MPKEAVYGDFPPFGDADPGVSMVEVRWGRDEGDVQVVSKAVDRVTHGRLSDIEGIHYTDGFYVNLDRRGINGLIRHLRRARDQAFGRDE